MLNIEKSEARRFHHYSPYSNGIPRVGLLSRLARWSFRVVLLFFVLSTLWVALYGFVRVSYTPLMVIRFVDGWWTGQEVAIEQTWKPLSKMSRPLWAAAIAAEDGNFLDHSGFDFAAIDRALESNRQGAGLRGASTISQQVAKNVFLWPSRTWLRKGAEAYFTVLIELMWSKRRILEVYLNVVEMGDGVYGAEAAAQKFFGKSAANLSSREAALLVAVLPNPRRYLAHRPSGYVRFRQGLILRRVNLIQARLESSFRAGR